LTASLRSFVSPPRTSSGPSQENVSEQALSHLLSVTSFYEEKVGSKSRSADSAMRIVAKEIERDGVHGVGGSHVEDPPYVGLLGEMST